MSETLSASVSETNRIRISMGLAPLADSSSSQNTNAAAAAANTAAAARAEAEEKARVEQIREELARRREKRLVSARVTSQSLGESLVSQTAGSARDWIERSRKLGMSQVEQDRQVEQARQAAVDAAMKDDAYSSRDLAGVKLGHDYGDFEKGSEVVLTLKDSRILSGVADGLNEEEDELMNQELADKEKQKDLASRRVGKTKNKHSAGADFYGEEEAELLAKYSDEKEKSGLRLGAGGNLSANEIDFQTNSAIYAQDEARRQMNQLVYSLDEGGNELLGTEKQRNFQTDYKEAKFKKKKKTTTKVKSEGDSMDIEGMAVGKAASEAPAEGASFKKKGGSSASNGRRTKAPSSFLDFLPEPSESDRLSDLSSRHAPSSRSIRESENEEAKRQEKDARYLRAIQTAESLTAQRNALDQEEQQQRSYSNSLVPPPPPSAPPASAFQNIAPPPPPPPMPPAAAATPVANLFEEEDDDALAESLARARRLAKQKEENEKAATASASATNSSSETKMDSVRALAERVKQEQKERSQVKIEPGTTGSTTFSTSSSRLPPGMSVKSGAPAAADGGMVFTSTTNFVQGLAIEKEKKPIAAGTQSVVVKKEKDANAMEVDDEDEKKFSSVKVEEGKLESEDEEEGGDQGPSEEDDEDDDAIGLDDEPVALGGMAAALKLLKSRGVLKEGSGKAPTAAGERKFEFLDKYDALGHELSAKEQFRAISHKFHGIEPGLKKQEKRLNRLQVEAQRQQALRETGGAIAAITEKQRAAGSAHVVFDKKVEQSLAKGASHDGGDEQVGKKRKKEAGPFAQFGFGKGGFVKKRKAQQEDAARKAGLPEQYQ